jgi:hypothetical protein
MSFYYKFVKPFIRNKDVYRMYEMPRILNATVVKQTSVVGGVINPTPLFHKVESKSPTMHGGVKTGKDLIAQVAKEKGVGVSAKKPQTPADRMAALKAAGARVKKK